VATIVVTGASAGIGAAAAIELTKLGHEVLAVGRTPSKLDATHRRMIEVAPTGVRIPEPVTADFASLAEVRRTANLILERCPRVDVLGNNAGCFGAPQRQESADGFELLLAVNYLAPFLLTNLLVERLLTSGGRVVTTSSVGHKRVERLDLDDLQIEGRYRSLHSYGRSKLANILFTSELTQRTGLAATCFNPGSVKTDILRDRNAVTRLLTLTATSPKRGADTLVWLATSAEGGAPAAVYYQRRKPAKTSAAARDAQLAARLWDRTVELVGC
jgi:NAD(P)-dependent dehydrogenase (short-subunit alcohol dehydrogenase family)